MIQRRRKTSRAVLARLDGLREKLICFDLDRLDEGEEAPRQTTAARLLSCIGLVTEPATLLIDELVHQVEARPRERHRR